MTTDYRELCTELLAWAEKTTAHYYVLPDVLIRARAALAEQPVSEPYTLEPPADGEVAELVAELRSVTKALNEEGLMGSADPCRRAADLLERLAEPEPPAITPIPISDRLPGQEDCDTEGRCWFWEHSDERWELLHHTIAQPNWTWTWLPFHALPLPAGDDA
jgi:hypothetical protein